MVFGGESAVFDKYLRELFKLTWSKPALTDRTRVRCGFVVQTVQVSHCLLSPW